MKRIFPFLLTASTICLLMLIISRKMTPLPSNLVTSKDYKITGAYVTADWANKEYTLVSEDSFAGGLHRFITNSPEYKSGVLTLDQSGRLEAELEQFFKAYNDGQYASYKNFRFPNGVAYEWKTNKFGSIQDVLFKQPGFGGINPFFRWKSSNFEATNSVLTNLSPEEKFRLYLHLFSGEASYSNYFTGVSFDESKIKVSFFTNEIKPPYEVSFWTNNVNFGNSLAAGTNYPNLGYFSQKRNYSLVKFKEDINVVKTQNGGVLVADNYFLIKRDATNTCLPVIFRCYWNPQKLEWLPDDLVVCSLWNLRDFTAWPYF